MDMRRIEAKDESFDLVWSSSSIEHLGSTNEIRASLREVARVLRPGGVHLFTTEWKLCGGFSYFPHSFIFDPDLLNRILADVPLEPLGPFDARFSRHSLNTPVWRGLRHVINELPHIVLYSRGVLNTSTLVALRKSNRTGHVFDFTSADPEVAEWLMERFARMKRELASPMTRARLPIDGKLGSWLARRGAVPTSGAREIGAIDPVRRVFADLRLGGRSARAGVPAQSATELVTHSLTDGRMGATVTRLQTRAADGASRSFVLKVVPSSSWRAALGLDHTEARLWLHGATRTLPAGLRCPTLDVARHATREEWWILMEDVSSGIVPRGHLRRDTG